VQATHLQTKPKIKAQNKILTPKMLEKKIIAIVGTALIVAIVLAALHAQVRLPSQARIKSLGLEIYWDEDCTEKVESINWGLLEPGESVSRTVYVKLTGNVPAVLNIYAENWTPPEAEDYISLSHNYTGSALVPEEVKGLTLTLNISKNIVGIEAFSFDIVFEAIEYA